MDNQDLIVAIVSAAAVILAALITSIITLIVQSKQLKRDGKTIDETKTITSDIHPKINNIDYRTEKQTEKLEVIVADIEYRKRLEATYDRKMDATGGSYLDLQLTDQQFQKYFDRRYSATQRFSVLFGMWWGLSEPQIRRISDLRQKDNCSRWLNYFICCPNASPDISVEELCKFRYTGKYLAEVYDHPAELARSQQPKLIPLDEVKSTTI